MRYSSFIIISLVLLFFANGISVAAETEKEIKAIEVILKKQVIDENEVRGVIKDLNTIKLDINETIKNTLANIDEIKLDITSIGEHKKGEDKEVSQKRKALTGKLADLENRLSQHRVMLLKVQDHLSRTTALHKRLLASRLLNKGPTIISLYQDASADHTNPLPIFNRYIQEHHGLNLYTLGDKVLGAVLAIIAVIAGIKIRSRIKRWVSTHQWNRDFSDRFLETTLLTNARYTPVFLGAFILAIFGFKIPEQTFTPFISLLFLSLPGYLILLCAIECFFNPKDPARQIIELPVNTGKHLATNFRVLVTISLLAFLFSFTLYTQNAPEQAIYLTRDSLSILLVINLFWIAIITRPLPQPRLSHILRIAIVLILAASLYIELIGYRNLAFFLLRSLVGITLSVGIFLLLKRLIHEIFTALDEGTKSWHQPIRRAFGLKQGEHIPGLTAFLFFSLLTLWLGLFYIVLRILGFSEPVVQIINESFINGFTVGSLQVNPSRLMIAVIVFTVLFTLSGWLKARLEKKWLIKTRIERGSREAIVTMAGYIGIAMAALIALGIAGFTFTNLAIIAGALSVGIGFGLQNIVNNFVSGLILLFERPIKKGDWIIVGATEGYVKKISIRSTQIQTFDRADVIVPNSDLISNQVTNWMLYDHRGRIRVPFGVAYGSDTGLVKNIILDVARSHEQVIKDLPGYRIRVLFLAFGDSALNFELRCHVQNIDERLQITSDLNFAIDKAFREHNIEIPFPQRDLHIRDSRTEKKDELIPPDISPDTERPETQA